MKVLTATVGMSMVLGLAQTPALADSGLAKAKNCTACHAIDKKVLGPAFKAIAVKYKEDDGATGRLAKKVRSGGVGVWGQIPMPANPQVSEAEATTLVKWILAQ
ncbi:MAG: c-type cytochrome [Burkholderiaceae bacterium]